MNINKGERRSKKRKKLLSVIIGTCLVLGVGYAVTKVNMKTDAKESVVSDNIINKDIIEEVVLVEKEIKKTEVVISVAGDCTLGTDTKFAYETSFPAVFKNNGSDYSYFMENVYDIFSEDDYTIVNLETTFTESDTKASKGGSVFYHFKGPEDYVNILTGSSIEGVTISNNHIYDYGIEGFNDTVRVLEENNVGFCGEGYKIVQEIKGIKFGFLGYSAWDSSAETKAMVADDINELRSEGVQIVIPYFHWGYEREYEPHSYQIELARFAIDNGADAVIGSHPHVMQTIEEYNGKLIAYSMGNFSFGGNSNPKDKRTFILQIKYYFEDDVVVNTEYKVIPTIISSRNDKNDYRPTVATTSREEILNTLNNLSPTLSGRITDEFFSLDSIKAEESEMEENNN